NGGLFEPKTHDFYKLDTAEIGSIYINTLTIPDKWFKKFFEILETYNFTLDESSSIDVELSVDPEMLGRIFENLLAEINPETGESARKSTGSFYTPRQIVDYMVDSSISAYLIRKTKIEPDKIKNLLKYDKEDHELNKEEIKKISNAIYELKILDPACGSGAFPMGILNKLMMVLDKFDPDSIDFVIKYLDTIPDKKAREEERDRIYHKDWRYKHKLSIIRNSIYGVDIQPIAADISKLRFFLSLVVDETINDKEENRGVLPLPNLEFKFAIANTLIGLPKKESGVDINLFQDETEANLKELIKEYFESSSEKKEDIKARITELQNEMVKNTIQWKDTSSSYFHLSDFKPFENKATHWFEPEWMFGLEQGEGFDIVIGNPPYVQIQKFSGLQCQKDWEVQKYETFEKTGDIYCLFYERGHQLLSQNGLLTFITSNKWMRANYGKAARKYFATKTNPILLVDFGGYKVFESATVDTNILMFENTKNQDKAIACAIKKDFSKEKSLEQYIDNNFIILNDLSEDSWIILSKEEFRIKRKIERIGTPLKNWDVKINYGIKTGFNEAFIIDGKKKDELIKSDPKSAEIIKPILRGRDIKRYKAEFADLWLLFIPWHFPLHKNSSIQGASIQAENEFKRQFPLIYKHLFEYKEDLCKRNQAETGIRYEWYAMQRCANTYYEEFEKEKIVWGNIAYSSSFIFEPKKALINAPANLLTSSNDDIKYILANM
ncbi:MAG: Eco57I restriction-modification methylase domain-containing protein, partial [Candidatus Delongbacteria bacterium]|nr:Eco57I restriction-modification methylase domain-containing protein [Candidatus Delongbacteria bacterium]